MNNTEEEKLNKEWAQEARKLSKEIEENIKNDTINFSELKPSKEELMQIGAELWDYSYAIEPDDDVKAFALIMKHFSESTNDELFVMLGAPDAQIFFSWLARWADQAFPQVIIGQKITAALMATSVSEDILSEIHAPWKAFMVDIPNGMIEVHDDLKNKNVFMTQLLVQQTIRDGEVAWHWMLSSPESTVQLWRFGYKTKNLIIEDMGFEDPEMCELFAKSIDKQDERIAQLIGRLIIGICLTFPGNNKPIGPGHKHSIKKGCIDNTGHKNLVLRNYELRPSIKIDCREIITDYVKNGNKTSRKGVSPTVRTLVRGHYRRPPKGIEKGLDKTVWVCPFWRGPEDGKIVVRAHEEIVLK